MVTTVVVPTQRYIVHIELLDPAVCIIQLTLKSYLETIYLETRQDTPDLTRLSERI